MIIYYGNNSHRIDVTQVCLTKLMYNNVIIIPSGDMNRASYFTDPLLGILKKIYIIHDNTEKTYDHIYMIKINTLTNTVTTINNNDIINKLSILHAKLRLNHGTFNEELPEQKIAVRYLTGNEKVLEIGSNIGRNSLIIASIVGSDNFVTLESDDNISLKLKENRDLNNFKFNIENSALSKRKLIQKNWETMPSEDLLPGYKWVNTITVKELKDKYKIDFDTLVLDCEGAFYYILMDMPEILDNINLIIMENDYRDISQKEYINSILTQHNFYIDYVEGGGWGPCHNNFYEVWKK